jgi:hypothetical protein
MGEIEEGGRAKGALTASVHNIKMQFVQRRRQKIFVSAKSFQ